MTEPLISQARSDADYATARTLFEEYAAALGVDLCFQGFAAEPQNLPGLYGAPSGCLLLARAAAGVIGCVAVRRLRAHSCELKRLYVRAAARGTGLGRTLSVAAIGQARALGYRHMLLDTLGSMRAARHLYQALGFRQIDAYYDNPLPDTVYMQLDLTPAGPRA
jgi:GNAT superfamily N-acetyltransferase